MRPGATAITVLALGMPLILGMAGCGGRPYLTYPDPTNWFYTIHDDNPFRSDLNLRQIACERRPDGTLVVTATVDNQGYDHIAPKELVSGDFAAYRVRTTFTSADGSVASNEGVVARGAPTRSTFEVAMARPETRRAIDDITRIDVVADPDHVVPDPYRGNNDLTWRGKLDSNHPQCVVTR